jgi:hypothetical protein
VGGNVETDKEDLAALAVQLRQAADRMNGPATSAPNALNVGDSTGAVAEMLGTLTRSAAALTETASKAADDLDACRSTYGGIDQSGADVFKNIS